jgi:hypothetical protein
MSPTTSSHLSRSRNLERGRTTTSSNYRAFGDYKDVFPRLNKIGWTKLQIISAYVTPDNRGELLKLAETHTAANLKAIIRGEEPIIGRKSVLLLFTQEQFAVFSKAIVEHGAIMNGQSFDGKEAALIKGLSQSKS